MSRDVEHLARELSAVVGDEHVLTGPAASGFAVDGVVPRLVVRPGSQEDVERVVAACGAAGVAVLAWGGGTAMGLGNAPRRLDVVVGLDRLTRVVEFDEANLNVSVEAGVRLPALQETLRRGREFLPLDPPQADRVTVGGLVASNASGPSRLLYGTARDWILGLRTVLPSGERIRSGGKVIKNVSGYDMNKLYIGSLGTLGIVTEVTFKLLPEPVMRATVVGVFAELPPLAAVVTRTLESHLLPEALEALDDQALAAVAPALGLADGPGFGLAVAVAGSRETVERQVRDFGRFFSEAGARSSVTLTAKESPAAWRRIADAPWRLGGPGDERAVAKAAVPIGNTLDVFAAASELARRSGCPGAVTAHAGSGVVRAGFLAGGGTGAREALREGLAALRSRAEAVEGSLVLEAAPPAFKRSLDAWGKARSALSVMQRLKSEFDPRGTMSPGRFLGGI